MSETASLPCPERKASKKASHLRPHLLATLPRADLQPEVTREVVKDRLTRLFACQALLLAKERVGDGYNWQAGILSTNVSFSFFHPSINRSNFHICFHSPITFLTRSVSFSSIRIGIVNAINSVSPLSSFTAPSGAHSYSFHWPSFSCIPRYSISPELRFHYVEPCFNWIFFFR